MSADDLAAVLARLEFRCAITADPSERRHVGTASVELDGAVLCEASYWRGATWVGPVWTVTDTDGADRGNAELEGAIAVALAERFGLDAAEIAPAVRAEVAKWGLDAPAEFSAEDVVGGLVPDEHLTGMWNVGNLCKAPCLAWVGADCQPYFAPNPTEEDFTRAIAAVAESMRAAVKAENEREAA